MTKNWKVVEHKVVKRIDLRKFLSEVGFAIAGNIGLEKLESLRLLFHRLHRFRADEGGMFYSLYSSDLSYRQEVHEQIRSIMKETYDELFDDYKTVINSFIVKLPGPRSDFTLHQDSTGLDEFKYSPLSVWIPLQDTGIENGTLCVVPKTHGFFHPYRGISFDPPFKNYENVLKRYLVPLDFKAGDILLFDNRLVHYSHENRTKHPRVVVMSGIFPTEAEILSVYKDPSSDQTPIEIFQHTHDYLITNTAFYENCTARPYRGTVVRTITEPLEPITVYDFLSWASNNNVQPTNIPSFMNAELNMQIISEPV